MNDNQIDRLSWKLRPLALNFEHGAKQSESVAAGSEKFAAETKC